MEDYCFLDSVFTVFNTHLGRIFLVVLLLFLYKELTMGMYRRVVDMTGKVVVITGGNSGVGLETARSLAMRGARVILGCRSRERGMQAVTDIKRTTNNEKVHFYPLDLLDLKSVRKFAKDIGGDFEKIDILINNAGMADGRKDRVVTRSKDKFEITLQTNHLSHFLLTNLLKAKLAAAGDARVINVSSMASQFGNIDLNNLNYEKDETVGNRSYHNSKLMNILFTKELSRRWSDIGVTSFALHPGFVRTNIFNDLPGGSVFISLAFLVGKNNMQGAQTSLYLSCEPGIEHMTGEYFVDCKPTTRWMNKVQAMDKDLCAGLWDKSAQLLSI